MHRYFLILSLTVAVLFSCIQHPVYLENDLVRKIEHSGDTYTVHLDGRKYVDTVVLEEAYDSVWDFEIAAKVDNQWKTVYRQDRIDKYRICVLDGTETDTLKITILKKEGSVRINKVSAYDSSSFSRKRPIVVSEYMTTEKGKLDKIKASPDYANHFRVIDDIILIGEVFLDKQGKIQYKEGKEDFINDLKMIREIKPEINIIVDIDIHKQTGKDGTETKNLLNAKRKEIVAEMVSFADETRIQGIDFDWEYPRTLAEWGAYSELIVALHAELEKSNRYITVALAPWGGSLSREACRAIKYVNLMTYDLFDDRGEHASFYNTTEKSVAKFLSITHFKKEQLFLGLSFYGRTVNQSPNAWPDFRYDYEHGKTMGKWGNYIYDYPYEEDGVRKTSHGYVNGYAMARDKTAYALYSDLGGIMIFRFICDAPYSYEYSLHKAVETMINKNK